MTSIYCGGEFVPMSEKDGWWWCGGCGKRLWLVGKTFEAGKSRVPSGHGKQEDIAAEINKAAGSQPAGAAEAGDV